MGDTGLGRHRRSSGSQASVVIRIRRRAFPASEGGARRVSPSRQTRATYLHGDFFRFTATRDTEKRARQWVSLYANREKWRPLSIGAWDANKESYAQGKHWERRWIDTGFFCERTQNGNALLGYLYWASSAGYLFFDIGRESHLFISTGTSTFFSLSFSSRSQSFPQGPGGLTGGHHWAGRMDLGGFRMAWKPGKGGRGGGFVSLPG